MIFHQQFSIQNFMLDARWLKKGTAMELISFYFYGTNAWMSNFTYLSNKLIPGLKTKQTIIQQKLRTIWYNSKLHEPMALRIHMFVQLRNSFPE